MISWLFWNIGVPVIAFYLGGKLQPQLVSKSDGYLYFRVGWAGKRNEHKLFKKFW